MRNEEWREVEELLDAALELAPAERREFVERIGAPALRREVESLLACEAEADHFLDAPALAFSADFFGEAGRAGQHIGPYRVVGELGRGGMGTVYLAERADGEFEQRVALKVVGRGFAGASLARRFRQERQILASLNHPNIARLLDGGVSAEGEPYLAMEYVEGARIVEYAAARALPTEERLRLFRQVCAAVQYAHQNLVIHRDIKPSNILVTEDGVPKLLDFGIAKLLDPAGSDTGAQTMTEMGVMTPEYASPEQVRGEAVTTATDVYSLGVVLYELLTGARPYDLKGLRLDEVLRAVCETEPARTKTLGGDLDNIILMSMRKEPERRYASVAQFSEDIRRHLDGLPVVARGDTFTYRATKFVRRNKAGVAAAALVVLTLVGGLVAVAWQARVAREQARVAAQERDRARVEAAKTERINAFLQSIFASADPSWYSSGHGQRGEVRVVDVLERAGRRVDAELGDTPETRAELHHTIGATYLALGRVEAALSHLRASLDAYRGLYGERHPEVAEALYYLAAAETRRDASVADALFRQSLELFRAVAPDNANVPYLLHDYSALLALSGETAAAERTAREGLELARRRYGEEHVLVSSFLGVLGRIYEYRGDLEQAEAFYRSALAIVTRLNVPAHELWLSLGHISFHRGDFEPAEAQYREALETARRALNEDNPRLATIGLRLAQALHALGNYAEAEREAAAAIDLQRRSGQRLSVDGVSLLSIAHARAGRPARAAAFLREALALSESLPENARHWDEGLLGEALVAAKREAEARTLLLNSHTYFTRTFGRQNPEAVRTGQLLDRFDPAPTPP